MQNPSPPESASAAVKVPTSSRRPTSGHRVPTATIGERTLTLSGSAATASPRSRGGQTTFVNDRPLVGRAAELATVLAQLERDPPVPVVIGGPAGVGKSRLLRQVAAWADERGWSTRLVIGTTTAAAIPFGAVVSLLADVSEDSSSAEILAHAKGALAGTGDRPAHLLLVDDAQRLDVGSATLVHQVVEEGVCPIVTTVRSGEPAPAAIAGLWTGSRAARIELAGLSLAETDVLLSGLLG